MLDRRHGLPLWSVKDGRFRESRSQMRFMSGIGHARLRSQLPQSSTHSQRGEIVMPKYVIVGASAAGIGAVEAIRDIDPIGSIAVISEEPCPQYSRPMISDFVSGKDTFQKMMCREDDFWKINNVMAFTGRAAVTLNLAEKYVMLNN